MLCHFRGASPRPVKVLVNPGMRVLQHSVKRIAYHATIDDHADPAAGPKQRIQVVRNHDHRQPQL
jgi:hypothetical protein